MKPRPDTSPELIREVVRRLRATKGLRPEELADLENRLAELSDATVRTAVSRARLLRLVEILGDVLAEANLNAQLERVLDGMIELSGARRGFLVLGESAMRAEAVISRNMGREDIEGPGFAPSRSVLSRAFAEQRTVRIRDAAADPSLAEAASIQREGVLSILCVPLVAAGRNLGAIYMDHNRVSGIFDEPTEEMLSHFASVISHSVFRAKAVEELLAANRRLRASFADRYRFEGIIGEHPVLIQALQTVAQVADSNASVLIQGETGTGKELIARALHNASTRAGGPFVAVNCAALPESLMESELFGHERGAFTGATERREGRLEVARGGTLLLDEIGELTSEVQARLLRFVQTGEVQRVGADKPHIVDVRVVAATHRDLSRMVEEGSFREDLYYRLNVVTVRLPALRERAEDLPLLIDHFLKHAAETQGRPLPQVDPEARFLLTHYDYPGNIRELENVLTRALLLCSDGMVRRENLPPALLGGEAEVLPGIPVPRTNDALKAIRNDVRREAVRRLERAFVERALLNSRGDVAEAARATGTNRTFFYELMKRYEITAERFQFEE